MRSGPQRAVFRCRRRRSTLISPNQPCLHIGPIFPFEVNSLTCYDEMYSTAIKKSCWGETGMWNWIIPIVTLIVGLVGGFFIGVYYLRKQMEAMQSNPEMLQQMAKKMGYNLNKKQMQQMQNMMKNQKWK